MEIYAEIAFLNYRTSQKTQQKPPDRIVSPSRLNIPIRGYLGPVLPGSAARPISQTTELTSAGWGNQNQSSTLPPPPAV
jgi:hypothetical protein